MPLVLFTYEQLRENRSYYTERLAGIVLARQHLPEVRKGFVTEKRAPRLITT